MKYSVIVLACSFALASCCGGGGGTVAKKVSNATLKETIDNCQATTLADAEKQECCYSICKKQPACQRCLKGIIDNKGCTSDDKECVWDLFKFNCVPTQDAIDMETVMSLKDRDVFLKDAGAKCTDATTAAVCVSDLCGKTSICKPCYDKMKKYCADKVPPEDFPICFASGWRICYPSPAQ